MSETFLVLERAVQADLDSIARLYAEIGQPDLPEDAPQDKLIVLSYHLHTSTTPSRTSSATLRRFLRTMWTRRRVGTPSSSGACGSISVRPALIDESAYEKLDGLRRFRRLFRSAYDVQLDAERLRLVLRKAVQLRRIYPPQMESFLEFVRAVRQER